MKRKEYRCCICHSVIETRPIRLVKQLHDMKETYGAFHNYHNYDFCRRCYSKFNNWVKKHEGGVENEINGKNTRN